MAEGATLDQWIHEILPLPNSDKPTLPLAIRSRMTAALRSLYPGENHALFISFEMICIYSNGVCTVRN